jgi:hypothetical protein
LVKGVRKAPKKGVKHDEYDHRRLDFTDYEPDPELEQEFFGNFRPTERDFSKSKRADGRYCSDGEFSRSGRGPRGWAAEPPGPPPYLVWAVWQAERPGERIRLDPSEPARPSDSFSRGVLHAERAQFYAQHTARRVQALVRRGFKPSKKLEAKRFPTLKRVAANPLLTRDYLSRGLRAAKDAAQAECQTLVAQFLAAGGEVRACPPEKLAVGVRAPKMGRPPLTGRALTTAERVRKHRMKLKTPAPHGRVETGVVRPLPLGLAAPVDFLQPDEQMIRRKNRR